MNWRSATQEQNSRAVLALTIEAEEIGDGFEEGLMKQRVSLIEVDGMTIRVARKNMKNMTLRVKGPDGRVEVSAPYRISDRMIVEFVRNRAPWIARRRAEISSSPIQQAEGADKQQIAQWKAIVKEASAPLFEVWEARIGVQATRISFKSMSSRWGSCSPANGHISLNVRLALYPPECLEYVIVHELCHLIVSGHGPAFKSLLDQHLPDWRRRRAVLR